MENKKSFGQFSTPKLVAIIFVATAGVLVLLFWLIFFFFNSSGPARTALGNKVIALTESIEDLTE